MSTPSTCPFDKLAREVCDICDRTFQRPRADGRLERTFHAFAIGHARGTLQILENIPDGFRHGLFAQAGNYPVFGRFSASLFPPDSYPDPVGLALRMEGVQGSVCPGAPSGVHNIVMINQPNFMLRNAEEMLLLTRSQDGRTIRTPWDLFPPDFVMPGFDPRRIRWSLVRFAPKVLLTRLKRQDLARFSYYSVSPYRLGAGAMKYQLHPLSPVSGKGRTLRARLLDHLRRAPIRFELRVQPQQHSDPLDDLVVPWRGPAHPVGVLEFPVQDIDDAALAARGESLGFPPWHCLQAHEPLGSINALRRVAYSHSMARRGAISPTAD